MTKTIRQNNIRDYLLRANFPAWKDNQQVHSHKELLRIIWNDPRTGLGIAKHGLFRTIGHNGKPLLDDNGNIQLFWDGKGRRRNKKEVIELWI